MYYVNVPVSLSYEADKNGGEVADCGVKYHSVFIEKNVPAFEIKCGHV